MSRTGLADDYDLVRELTDVCGLDEYSAPRWAFVVMTHNQGWSGARIGRYLGVSRARVDQILSRLREFAGIDPRPDAKRSDVKYGLDVPVLTDLLKNAQRMRVRTERVGFAPEDWQDDEFAAGMLKMISVEMSANGGKK